MADDINGPVRERERVVDRTDSGVSGLVWVVIILLLLIAAYFIFSTRNADNDINATPDTVIEQEQTTEGGTTNETPDPSTNEGTDTTDGQN